VDFGTSTILMDVGVIFEKIVLEYIIWKSVEKPDYVIRNV